MIIKDNQGNKEVIKPIGAKYGEDFSKEYMVIKIPPPDLYQTIKHPLFTICDNRGKKILTPENKKHWYILLLWTYYIDNKTNMLIYNNRSMTIENMAVLSGVNTKTIQRSIAYWNSQNIIKYYQKAFYINPFYFQNGCSIKTVIYKLFIV